MQTTIPPKAYIPVTHTQVANLSCSHCFLLSLRTLLCSACHRVGYCNKVCQKKDWKEHKLLCKQFQKVNEYDKKIGHLDVDPSRRLDNYLLQQRIRGDMFQQASDENPYGVFPVQLITYGKKCQVCFCTPFQDAARKFSACFKCKLAWWCSEDCKVHLTEAHSASQCAELRTTAAVDAVRIAYALARRSGRGIMVPTEEPAAVYVPPSTLSGWAAYYHQFAPLFEDGCANLGLEFHLAHPLAAYAAGLLITESASIPLTLLSALEDTIPDVQTRSKLRIHIVGAADKETMSTGMLEELLHYLPSLKIITLVFIGPELTNDATPSNRACQSCQRIKRRRTIICWSGTYHEFAGSQEYRTHPPDLIAGFNTGMSEIEVSGWRTSLGVILGSAAPAVFTSYTEFESEQEVRMLRGLSAAFVKDLEKNRWRGVVATIDEMFNRDGKPGHYTNHYRFIVQGRSSQA